MGIEEEKKFSLENIGNGATIERFNLALQEVLDNIQDLNTDPKKARKVVMTVTIVPDEDRGVGRYLIDVAAKTAPIKPHPGRVFLGRNSRGKGVATEDNPVQAEMTELMQQGETKIYALAKE